MPKVLNNYLTMIYNNGVGLGFKKVYGGQQVLYKIEQ